MIRNFAIVAITSLILPFPKGVACGSENLIRGGDFEQGMSGWSSVWARESPIRALLDTEVRHGGRQSVRIEHGGSRDWALAQAKALRVKPGEIYDLSGWTRVEGNGSVRLSVTLRDAREEVMEWEFSGRSTQKTDGWKQLHSRFVVPPGAASMLPRLTGQGPCKVWFDDARLTRTGTIDALRSGTVPAAATCSNANLEVTFRTSGACFNFRDLRSNRTWRQRAVASWIVLSVAQSPGKIQALLLDPASLHKVAMDAELAPDGAELEVRLSSSGELADPISFPPPMISEKGSFLILPVNEGISYPVDDATLDPTWYHLYGGHGLCMPWWGTTDGKTGVMGLVETPNDAAVRIPRVDGLLCLAPEWQAEKQQFGPPRRMRYVFFDRGGYVAMAKRYRQYAKDTGLFKTFLQKRAENAKVDLLIGAVNVWCWDRRAAEICRELQSAGIQRILWSAAAAPEQIRRMNQLGVLTSRYDIYQDVMDPALFGKLRGIHPDWTTAAWPKDIILHADGSWQHGWEIRGKDGAWYPCGVLCDRQAVAYARERIPKELETHPYGCRFIDTTTAAPWNECYSPDHPMTRSQSRRFKMDLLEFVSRDCGLVTGSETGHDAAVPYVHYFEGMLSLGPYRVPDAGRDMQRILQDVPERLAKFQTGPYYRLPLWELVYHDCVVAQWYWGDYNNKLPKLWDRRDLLNALYGTPPMFMFDAALWRAQRGRFVESYRTATPVARATGYAEMLSHRWLTADHTVQESRFANGVTVTVNFGERPYTLPDGGTLAPGKHRVVGLPAEPGSSG
ncbi:MAG: glycoside hydrolase [Thermoguttaceae bacterium]